MSQAADLTRLTHDMTKIILAILITALLLWGSLAVRGLQLQLRAEQVKSLILQGRIDELQKVPCAKRWGV